MAYKLFSKKHLLKALKKAGLPYSYPSLVTMERKGIIPQSDNAIGVGTNRWRLYTKEELDMIVERVRQYKSQLQNQLQ